MVSFILILCPHILIWSLSFVLRLLCRVSFIASFSLLDLFNVLTCILSIILLVIFKLLWRLCLFRLFHLIILSIIHLLFLA